ncbi:MAG: hypothetical protein L0958_03680 [Candidatus Mariimomonas ferrooxydans]
MFRDSESFFTISDIHPSQFHPSQCYGERSYGEREQEGYWTSQYDRHE